MLSEEKNDRKRTKKEKIEYSEILFVWTDDQHHGILKWKYHCTVDLLFDLFGLVCFANKNKNCQLPYSCFQISQTGGQWYSDTSPFNIPCQDEQISGNTRTWLEMVSKLWVFFAKPPLRLFFCQLQKYQWPVL
jgi:hypothetical protein